MIDHEEYRRALLSDPRSVDPEMRRHVDACVECAAYTEGLLRFESRLERALRLDVKAPPGRLLPPSRGSLPNRFALAASLLLALAVAGTVWLAAPRSSLAAAVVAHMAGEPDAWNARAPVSDRKLESVLKPANMHLKAGAGVVSYAHSCEFRGHVVPHLVVQSASGPVTVLVLEHESVGKEVQLDEQGYRGVIVPVADHGSIALLAKAPGVQMPDVEGIAARVRDAIVWSP